MTAISPFTTAPARKDLASSAAAKAAAKTAPATVESATQPNFVAIYSSTIFAMTMLFLFGTAIPIAMVYGNAAGWGIGAFSAFWGGPSFGVMAASARVSAWYEKHDVEF